MNALTSTLRNIDAGIRWVWKPLKLAFLIFAVGFFTVDALTVLLIWTEGWNTLEPTQPIQPDEFVAGAKELLNLKIHMTLVVSVISAMLYALFGGLDSAENSIAANYIKRHMPTATRAPSRPDAGE